MDCSVQVHALAIHSEPGYESVVPGIGLLCEREQWFGAMGQYSNSIRRASIYATAGWYATEFGQFRVGVVAGAATGYREGAQAVPLGGVVLSAKVNWGPVNSINALLVPKVEGLTPAFVQFNFTLKP